EPSGRSTALRTLLGGSPPVTIGASWPAPATARRDDPCTAMAVEVCLTAAGDWEDTTPIVTKTTRISPASPTTIMAGRMEKPREEGGRRGSVGSGMTLPA